MIIEYVIRSIVGNRSVLWPHTDTKGCDGKRENGGYHSRKEKRRHPIVRCVNWVKYMTHPGLSELHEAMRINLRGYVWSHIFGNDMTDTRRTTRALLRLERTINLLCH